MASGVTVDLVLLRVPLETVRRRRRGDAQARHDGLDLLELVENTEDRETVPRI